MANKTDKNDSNPVSAEAIYTHYQQKRSEAAKLSESGSKKHPSVDSPFNVNATQVDSTLAETLYKHYQTTRASDAYDPIDAIMQKIDEQSINQLVRQEEQPSVSQIAPDIHSIDATPVVIDEAHQDDASAANNSNVLKRWLLPAVAAAILSVVLIPQLMNTGSSPEPDGLQATLPAALSDNAAQTVAYIEAPVNSSFGFADTSNAAQVAFNNGTMVTDLQLLVDAEHSAKIRVFLRVIAAALDSTLQDSTQNDIAKLSNTIRSNAGSMDAAVVAGENKVNLHKQLEKLGTALEDMAQKNEQLDWYSAGRFVEAIRVAAEYSLANTDIEPLEKALLLGSELTQPKTLAPASRLLPKLLQADLSGPEEFVKVAELLNDANDIKLLMQ